MKKPKQYAANLVDKLTAPAREHPITAAALLAGAIACGAGIPAAYHYDSLETQAHSQGVKAAKDGHAYDQSAHRETDPARYRAAFNTESRAFASASSSSDYMERAWAAGNDEHTSQFIAGSGAADLVAVSIGALKASRRF